MASKAKEIQSAGLLCPGLSHDKRPPKQTIPRINSRAMRTREDKKSLIGQIVYSKIGNPQRLKRLKRIPSSKEEV